MSNYTNANMTFNESVDTVSTTYVGQQFPLGMYRERDGKGYRFVKFDNGTGNVASVVGGLAYIKAQGTAEWTVTMDVSDTTTNAARGIFLAVVTDAYYCWIQTKGYYAVAKTDAGDDFVAGDAAVAHATTDGVVDRTAKGTAPVSRVVGWAAAADVDADDTVALDLVLD